jgi:hypothetical protein
MTALTKVVNLLARGTLPQDLAPILCSANLFAANKKEAGSYRPIAVGEVLRRLTAKCLAFAHAPNLASHLNPHQLGVGTKSGCEAVLHATQALLSDVQIPDGSKWILQVDYTNAFNTMDRSHIIKEVREHAPGLSAFVEWSYGGHTPLFFGEHLILSEAGLQQGDPLGPLLFSIGLQSIVLQLVEEVPELLLVAWFLDDGVLVGCPVDIVKAFLFLREASVKIGLHLSLTKTTFWRPPSCRGNSFQSFDSATLPIPEAGEGGVILLGAPIGLPEFCVSAVKSCVTKCVQLMVQVQFALLRSCFGFPKFSYCLRSCDPAILKDAYVPFDEGQCRALSDCIGAQIYLDDPHWLHASLPVSMGGLGIRSAVAHSSAAFVASILQTENLVRRMVGNHTSARDPTQALGILTSATANATTPISLPLTAATTQKSLSRCVDESSLFRLMEATTGIRHKALISSVQLSHTGDFLNVVPSAQLGLQLRAIEFRLACQYRLGLAVYPQEGPCSFCNKPSDMFGDHAISACGHSGDRTRRHDSLRDALYSTAQATMLAPKKEEIPS